jgi:Icc-related predicted phosphoesterase
MRILAVADKVEPNLYPDFDRDNFPKVDLILACGDLPPEYLTYLSANLRIPLAYVRGNHDFRYEGSPPVGCINLHGRILNLEGLRLLGLEGSRWYNGGPVQYTEREMGRQIARLRWALWRGKGVDLVVTHAPPRHIHDAEDPCHRGFRCFNTLIRRYAPRYFIHGHIHEHFESPGDRITRIGGTQVINVYGHYLLELP